MSRAFNNDFHSFLLQYRQAGIIETEASIKAALVLIEQRQTLAAAEFLQNAVFISLQLTEDEKV